MVFYSLKQNSVSLIHVNIHYDRSHAALQNMPLSNKEDVKCANYHLIP